MPEIAEIDKPASAKLSRRTRIAQLLIGLAVKDLTDRAFDYLLYPFVIYKLGILKGGLVMTCLACAVNLLVLWFYDWSKRDWLGIETIKEMKSYRGESKFGRLTAWVLQRSDPVVLIFLSIKEDAFITLIYLRHGSHQYNGMSKRDWGIFLSSLVIASIYWTLAAYMGISLVEWLWQVVQR